MIRAKTSSGSNAPNELTTNQIVLLDGRIVDIDFTCQNIIFCDVKNAYLDFSWTQPESVAKRSLLTILKGMLSTHSLPYVVNCNYFTSKLFDLEESNVDKNNFVSLAFLENWNNTAPASAHRFVMAMLRKWIVLQLPGLGSDLVAFLESPEKFEEKGKGAFFALVVNDQERGAFTEQELRSIREGLNYSYEQGLISTMQWALVWFLIARLRAQQFKMWS